MKKKRKKRLKICEESKESQKLRWVSESQNRQNNIYSDGNSYQKIFSTISSCSKF